MYGKVKLTKKQIKEDKFTTFMLTTKNQVTENWQYFAIGLVVLILAIAAVVFYIDMQSKQEIEASTLYSQGVTEFRQQSYQNALLTLQLVLDQHDGTEPAQQATFLLGDVNLRTKNYPEAIRYFEMYIKKYSNDKLKVAASHAGIATAYENQGQFQQAADEFVKASSVNEDGPLVGDYYYSAMRNFLEIGDESSAKIQYDKIMEKFEGTNLIQRAEILFAEKSKH